MELLDPKKSDEETSTRPLTRQRPHLDFATSAIDEPSSSPFPQSHESIGPSNKKTSRRAAAAQNNNAKSGWGEENSSSGKAGRRNTSKEASREEVDANDEPSQRIRTVGDSMEKISAIPDLHDTDDQFETDVAEPPSVKINRVMTIKELDKDLEQSFSTTMNKSLYGFDLTILHAALCPPELCIEEDVYWDWDVIFTEACSDQEIAQDLSKNERESRTSIANAATTLSSSARNLPQRA